MVCFLKCSRAVFGGHGNVKQTRMTVNRETRTTVNRQTRIAENRQARIAENRQGTQ